MREINARNPLVFPSAAEGVLIVKETELFYNIIHDKVGVDTWFGSNKLLVGLTELDYLIDL